MTEKMREASQGPNKSVSSCLDNWRNQVDRYEPDGEPRLVVTLAPDSPVTAAQVEAWYWQSIGEWAPDVSAWQPEEN